MCCYADNPWFYYSSFCGNVRRLISMHDISESILAMELAQCEKKGLSMRQYPNERSSAPCPSADYSHRQSPLKNPGFLQHRLHRITSVLASISRHAFSKTAAMRRTKNLKAPATAQSIAHHQNPPPISPNISSLATLCPTRCSSNLASPSFTPLISQHSSLLITAVYLFITTSS